MTELLVNDKSFENFSVSGDKLIGNKEFIEGKGNSLCYKNLGELVESNLLTLWHSLKRNEDSYYVCDLIDKLMEKKNEYITNLIFKILMQSRDCRGGKGEKKIIYEGLLRMNKYLPKTTEILITEGLLEYGYAKDLVIIWDKIYGNSEYENINKAILNFLAEGIKKNNPYIIKYVPRENKKYRKMVDYLIKIIYPELVSYESIGKAFNDNLQKKVIQKKRLLRCNGIVQKENIEFY